MNKIDPSGKQGECPSEIPECNDPWSSLREMWEAGSGFVDSYTGPLGYYRTLVHFSDWVYRKDNPIWNCDVNGDGQYNDDEGTHPSDTSLDIVRDFVCEYEPQTRYFNEHDQSTKNLRNSAGITIARNQFYWLGKSTGVIKGERKFGFYAVLVDANLDIPVDGGINHILGGYSYIIQKFGPWLRFRVENNMTRQSGMRLPNSYEGTTYEDVLKDSSLVDAPVESILRSQTREETTDPTGGGNMKMIYYWHEFYDECRYPVIQYPNAPVPTPVP